MNRRELLQLGALGAVGSSMRPRSSSAQPSRRTGVRVQLEAAPFDTLVTWLAALDERYGLAVDSITVDRNAQPGTVNASITFSQPRR